MSYVSRYIHTRQCCCTVCTNFGCHRHTAIWNKLPRYVTSRLYYPCNFSENSSVQPILFPTFCSTREVISSLSDTSVALLTYLLWNALPISIALPRPSGLAHRCWHWTLGGSRWDVIVEREGSRAIDRIALRPLYICIIRVVNKSLSVEVPCTGRFWQHKATKNNKRDNSDEQGDEQERKCHHIYLVAYGFDVLYEVDGFRNLHLTSYSFSVGVPPADKNQTCLVAINWSTTTS